MVNLGQVDPLLFRSLAQSFVHQVIDDFILRLLCSAPDAFSEIEPLTAQFRIFPTIFQEVVFIPMHELPIASITIAVHVLEVFGLQEILEIFLRLLAQCLRDGGFGLSDSI